MSARTSPGATFTVLALAAASFTLLQSLINPVLPTIQRDLATSQSTVTWVLTGWLLSAAIATPLLGRIGDMAGKRRTLLIALAAIAVGNLVAALAPTIGVLIAARVLQGLGGAVFPLAFGIIRDEFPRARVASAVGALSAIIAVGGGLGVVLAGPIVGALGWRWLFWIPMIVTSLVGVLAVRLVPESPVRSGGRINWAGAALLAGWLVALLLPLSQAHAWGWGSPMVIGLFAVAAILLAAWIVVEYRSGNPVIDMRMMRLPAVWTVNLVALLFGASMFSVYAFLPQFTQTPASTGYGFGASVTLSGLLLLPMLVTMAIAGFVSGPLAPVVSFRAQLAIGSAVIAVSSAAIVFAHSAPWQIAVESGVFGLGLGIAYSAMSSLVVQAVPAHQTGAASGMNVNVRTIGGAIGTAVFSTIVTGNLDSTGLPLEAGYTDGFIVLAAFAVAAALVALLVPSAARAAVATAPEAETEPDRDLRVPAEVA
ncbi:MFS transporter [Lacisediminihabitans sp.]|uniref:MFS transporter n=1 Tax=Lacisediminihabitans sp. TaxID=2787631 RepID=UPI00374DDF85